MTDSERFYCARCYALLSCTSCEIEECPKCETPILMDTDWISEAEYRKRTAKVDADVESWNALQVPRMARDQRP